jgi:hypothetical protein
MVVHHVLGSFRHHPLHTTRLWWRRRPRHGMISNNAKLHPNTVGK